MTYPNLLVLGKASAALMVWHTLHQQAALPALKVIGCSSLRGGVGELGTNKNFDL